MVRGAGNDIKARIDKGCAGFRRGGINRACAGQIVVSGEYRLLGDDGQICLANLIPDEAVELVVIPGSRIRLAREQDIVVKYIVSRSQNIDGGSSCLLGILCFLLLFFPGLIGGGFLVSGYKSLFSLV